MKPELTIAKLAEIGAKASRKANGCRLYGNLSVDPTRYSYANDQPFREAFAQAVRDAVLDHIAESDKMVAPDPYAELRAAHAAGKTIQLLDNILWADCLKEPDWSAPVHDYRIKPEPVIVPLDMDDLRATDEFKQKHGETIYPPLFWDKTIVRLWIMPLSYQHLASDYLRRQHGSNEWKPCTKEITK
jgi:hypothetical protein